MLGGWVEGELVGFTNLYWTFSSISAKEIVLLADLFVDERIRGSGVGLALIEAAVGIARERGAGHIEWLTALDNRRAQRLYERIPTERSAWFGYEIALGFARDKGYKRIRGRLPQQNQIALSFLSGIGALVPMYNPETVFELPIHEEHA